MNADKLLDLAEHMDRVPVVNFRMDDWFSTKIPGCGYVMATHYDITETANDMLNPECGTAACVAGHAMLLFGLSNPRRVADTLDLTKEEARALFYGPWCTPAQVAGLLRALAAWQQALEGTRLGYSPGRPKPRW